MTLTADSLPKSVRYVKNGERGKWWPAARDGDQIHLGWNHVPSHLLRSVDLTAIAKLEDSGFGNTRGSAARDRKALTSLIDRPSQHVWVTFESGYMWWCTVRDDVETSTEGSTNLRGNFWLNCNEPWRNHSLSGRLLAVADLSGVVTTTAGFQGTTCEPGAWKAILALIRDEEDADSIGARHAREAYEAAIEKLVSRLRPKDFEVLTDLILSRTGWARLAKLGGATEGLDVEVENPASGEIAFVQVKSSASQKVLDGYTVKFSDRRERYSRMIFVVHTPTERLTPSPGEPVQVWTGQRIAQLVVQLGLGDWVSRRI